MEQTTEYIKNFSDWRNERAKLVLEKGNPESVDEFTYLVPSQNSDKKYKVTHIDTYSCECEDFKRRCQGKNLYCKHIKAILLFEKIKAKYEVKPEVTQKIELIIEQPQKDVCPYCSCDKMFKRGTRKTKVGVKQLYCCKSCKKRFVLQPISHIKGNSKLVWNADETLILTKEGKNKENTNYHYVWNVMDNKTKFLLASINSGRSRKSKDAQKVFTEAWKQNGKIPYQIITDRYAGYQDGVRKTFRNWGTERKVKHTSIVGKRKVINNNAIESQHALMKDFHKVRKGVKEVQTYQDGYKVFHNFVRKSARKGLTPADKCGVGVQGNRWNTLLLNSIKQQKATSLTGEENMMESH